MGSRRWWLRLAGLAAAGVSYAGCVTGEVGDAPEGAVQLDAVAGDVVVVDELSVQAPVEGTGVWSEWIFADGSTRSVRVETTLDGRVLWLPHQDLEQAGEEAASGSASSALPPCQDSAFNPFPWRWDQPYRWHFRTSTTPSNVAVNNAVNALKRAVTNITRSDNSCGMADQVSATHVYQGTTSKGVQMSNAGVCHDPNGENGVAFGTLPAGILGVACVWYAGGVAQEGDIRLNKRNFKWIANIGSSCNNRWSIEAVATHEMGHIFGLAHVGEAKHGNLTMSPIINASCSNAEASLGRGDVLGLRSKY